MFLLKSMVFLGFDRGAIVLPSLWKKDTSFAQNAIMPVCDTVLPKCGSSSV